MVDLGLPTLMTFRHDRVLLQWEHLDLTLFCALGHGDLGRDLAWPLSWKTPRLHLNVRAQMLGAWSWGGLLWASCSSLRGFHGPPRGQCCGRLWVSPLPDSPSLGHGGPSGGLPGNHSNFPAPSGWVGRQVHPVGWLQGTWIRQKANGIRWGCCRDLLQVDRPTQQTPALPLAFQPCVWCVFSAPQRDKKGPSLPEPR